MHRMDKMRIKEESTANFKAEVSAGKYVELEFVDRIITFLRCMYQSSSLFDLPIDLFVAALNTLKTSDILSFVNSNEFLSLIQHYYSSRFLITSMTHICQELYSLPVAIVRMANKRSRLQPIYYFFFEPAHIAQLIVSTFKLYYLHDGDGIEVKQLSDEKNSQIDIDIQYDFLLRQYEAEPLTNALARVNGCISSSPEASSNYALSDNAEDKQPAITYPGYKPSTYSMNSSLPSFILSENSQRPVSQKTIFSNISEAIQKNQDTFLLLTIIIQVLESFQFIDSTPVDKSVEIVVRKPSKSFAKTRIGRTSC